MSHRILLLGVIACASMLVGCLGPLSHSMTHYGYVYDLGGPKDVEKWALEDASFGSAMGDALLASLRAAEDKRFWYRDEWLQVAIRLQLRMQKGWPEYVGNKLSLEGQVRVSYAHAASTVAADPRYYEPKVSVAFMEAVKPSPVQTERYDAWLFHYRRLVPGPRASEEPPLTKTYFEIDPTNGR